MEFKKINSWVEKYRPSNLDEITAQKEVINALKKTLVGEHSIRH